MTFSVQSGPSSSITFPTSGPYDERLGYTTLPRVIARSKDRGFRIESQARPATALQDFIARGGYAVYSEKAQTGLHLGDRNGATLYARRFPEAIYNRFTEVPPIVAKSLLFIEDRHLLDARYPQRNPAIVWDRFFAAAATRLAGLDGPMRGGASTLATQIEKFRHSPQGRTGSPAEKIRQMMSASVRAYRAGPDSTKARRNILVTYLNSTPLGSRPGYGEIIGIADGLKVWYGTDFIEANGALSGVLRQKLGLDRSAEIYKQMLSLLLAQRRPAYYLGADLKPLERLTTTYLHLLHESGQIDTELFEAALTIKLKFTPDAPAPEQPSFTDRKAVDSIRADLLKAFGTPGLYGLDRLDVDVQSTIDSKAQAGVTAVLKQLGDRKQVHALGMVGTNMLTGADPSKIIYSVVLYERGERYHALRVHADSLDAPFNINSGAKLILGSTAKLRTVATYLNVIHALHQRYGGTPAAELRAIAARRNDPLTAWAIGYLLGGGKRDLNAMLHAAMQRRYSASPYEAFYTGGGMHRFVNFNKDDNARVPSVEVALQHSINLPMIRLMRDITRYYSSIDAMTRDAASDEDEDAAREAYLRRFADKEGRTFLNRFFAEQQPLNPAERLALLTERAKAKPYSWAVIFRSLRPTAKPAELEAFLRTRFETIDRSQADYLYNKYGPEQYSLADRAFLARLHPLELWLAAYLQNRPDATRTDIMTAGADVRQESYSWLFKTKNRQRQESRIRVLREEDAFKLILEDWRRQGYPFNQLVPSYATAIGSSGDRPDALARLMGIIQNDGVDVPAANVERITLAEATPYETTLVYSPSAASTRVFAPEVAAQLRHALANVVERGTAVRLRGTYNDSQSGHALVVGGKTGTGDNRFKTFGAHGGLTDSRSVDRTATFAFFIGDRLFGTITAYVPGREAEQYAFTSSLVVQLLKAMAPTLQPLLDDDAAGMAALNNITAAPTAVAVRTLAIPSAQAAVQ